LLSLLSVSSIFCTYPTSEIDITSTEEKGSSLFAEGTIVLEHEKQQSEYSFEAEIKKDETGQAESFELNFTSILVNNLPIKKDENQQSKKVYAIENGTLIGSPNNSFIAKVFSKMHENMHNK